MNKLEMNIIFTTFINWDYILILNLNVISDCLLSENYSRISEEMSKLCLLRFSSLYFHKRY